MYYKQEITIEINKALDVYFPVRRGVRIIAEPGRYFAASAFHLAVNVIARRLVTCTHGLNDKPTCLDTPTDLDTTSMTPDSSENFMYYVNDGVYGSFLGKFLAKEVRDDTIKLVIINILEWSKNTKLGGNIIP